MPPQHKTKPWRAATDELSVATLAAAIEPDFKELLAAGGFNYDSDDMKKGIQIEPMKKWKDMWGRFLKIDDRGMVPASAHEGRGQDGRRHR